MEVFIFLMRSAFPVMALTTRAIIRITLLSWAATCIGLFAEAAGSGTATCTIPSVREGEEATLTCTFENVNLTGAKAITVNAHGLNISGPMTDDALSVLVFKKSDTGWQQNSLNSNFLLKNGTVISVQDMLNVLVTIPKATEGYEGEYSCKLVGRGTPDPQSCHFLLDMVRVDYLNETSVLLYLELQNVSADSRKNKLMQRVDVGLQDAGEIMKSFTLTPPHTSYTVTGLEYNTKYEMIIYQGPAQVPVTRTVCIPTVQSLTTSVVNTSCVRVDWKPSVCDNSIVNHAYRICYKNVVSEDNCTDSVSEKPFTFINDPDTGAVYEISVQVMIDGKIIGDVTAHKAVLKNDTNTQDEGNGELKAWEIAVIVIAIVVGALLITAAVIFFKRSKKLKKKKETGSVAPTTSSGADGQEQIPLLEVSGHQDTRIDVPAPADSSDTQPAGAAPDRVPGPENRPQDSLPIQAEVHPIAAPPSGSEPAGATPNTSLALDVPLMGVPNSQEEHIVSTESEVSSSGEAGHDLTPDSGCAQVPNSQEEHIVLTESEVSSSGEAGHDLTPDSGCAQETEAKRELRKSYQDLEKDLQDKVDEINQLERKLQFQESYDGLKAMREEFADKEKDLKETEQKLKAAMNECSRLQSLLKDLQERYEQAERQSDKRITELESNVKLCKSLIDSKEAQENSRRIDFEQQLQEQKAEREYYRGVIDKLEEKNKEINRLKDEQILALKQRIMVLETSRCQHEQSAKGGQSDEEGPQRDDMCLNAPIEGASMGIHERPDNHDEVGKMEAAAADKTRLLDISDNKQPVGTETGSGITTPSFVPRQPNTPESARRALCSQVSDTPPPTVVSTDSVESEGASGPTSSQGHMVSTDD